MLDDLVATIETLKARIRDYGDSLRQNEYRTRAALIDPLLKVLGWDVADPSLVTPEYKVGSAGNSPRADYGLLDNNGNLVSAIEAKHLGESLANHEKQIFDYAWNLQIKFAGLTDGDHWYFVDLSQIASSDKTILQLRLTDTPTHEAALKLLLLWRPNLASGQPVAASTPVVAATVKPILESVPPTLNPTPAVVSPVLATFAPEVWTPLSYISDADAKGQRHPKAVKFNDGEPRVIRAWWQVLAEVANCLSEYGYLTIADCPIGTGKGWQFINSVPRSPRGRNFAQPKQIPSGLYLEAKMSSHMVVRHSKRLLAYFNVDPTAVELRFE